MRAWRLVPEPEMRTVMRTGATSEGEEEVITVVVVVVVVTMVSMGTELVGNTYSTGTSHQKKDLHVKHGCSMPHALAFRGDRYHDCRDRAGGGRREIRSLGAILQGARSVASVLQCLSMTMAWMPMPLAVPKFFQVVRGHGRDDFDLSFVTYLTYLTYTIPPTYLPTSYPNQTLLVHIHQSQDTDTYLPYQYTPYLPHLHINHPQSCQKASSPAPTSQLERH